MEIKSLIVKDMFYSDFLLSDEFWWKSKAFI